MGKRTIKRIRELVARERGKLFNMLRKIKKDGFAAANVEKLKDNLAALSAHDETCKCEQWLAALNDSLQRNAERGSGSKYLELEAEEGSDEDSANDSSLDDAEEMREEAAALADDAVPNAEQPKAAPEDAGARPALTLQKLGNWLPAVNSVPQVNEEKKAQSVQTNVPGATTKRVMRLKSNRRG